MSLKLDEFKKANLIVYYSHQGAAIPDEKVKQFGDKLVEYANDDKDYQALEVSTWNAVNELCTRINNSEIDDEKVMLVYTDRNYTHTALIISKYGSLDDFPPEALYISDLNRRIFFPRTAHVLE